MSEFWGWIERSVAYAAVAASLGVLALLAMRLLAG